MKFNLFDLSFFSFLLGVVEIADRYGAEEVIGEEALVVVEADLEVGEVEVEGEALVVDATGGGSVWMATVHILG